MSKQATTSEAATYPRGFPINNEWHWPLVPARKLVALNYGRALKAEVRKPGSIPVFGTNGQCGWHDKSLVEGPGLILGRKGQGPLGVEWCDKDFWVIDTGYYATTLIPDVDLKYLYQLVRYIGLNHLKDGTSNPTLSRDTFGAQLLPHPPLAEQKRIAHILGTLDDKIELNRRMNATLEALARALFQSWFVDFDPVRRNAEGGDSRPEDALFPDSFEDSAMGEIPNGWRTGTLGDVAKNPRRAVAANQIENDAAYIGLEHMPRKCIALSEWGSAEKLESNKSQFKRGEILFGKLRPYFHKVGVAPVDGVCSTDILVIAPCQNHWFGFVLAHASSVALIDHTDALSTGTKMPRTKWQDIAGFKVVLPPDEVGAAFTRLVTPAIEQICANIHQSRTLATLRDTLLPKLLSGELSLTEVSARI